MSTIGTPTLVGHNGRAGSFNSVSLSGVTVSAGTTLLVWAGGGNSTATTITITDSVGNTYHADISGMGSPSIAQASSQITTPLASGTITATWDTTVNTDYLITVVSVTGLTSGLGTATPVTGTGATSGWMGGAGNQLVVAGADELVIGGAVRAVTTTSTPSGSNIEIDDFNTGSSRTISVVYQLVAVGTYNTNGVWASTGTWRGTAASYAAAPIVGVNVLPPFVPTQAVPYVGTPLIRN